MPPDADERQARETAECRQGHRIRSLQGVIDDGQEPSRREAAGRTQRRCDRDHPPKRADQTEGVSKELRRRAVSS